MGIGASEMAPWVKALTANPEDLSLFHRTYRVEEEGWLLKLSSDVHVCSIYSCKDNFQELDTA